MSVCVHGQPFVCLARSRRLRVDKPPPHYPQKLLHPVSILATVYVSNLPDLSYIIWREINWFARAEDE